MNWLIYGGCVVSASLVMLAGCHHIGPKSVVIDRLEYNQAIATSWKEQALLNLVRDRYFDVIESVDVSSVLNSYQNDFTGTATLGSMIYPNDAVKNVVNMGLLGGRSLSDRPTITYTPQTGSEFMRNVLNPIPAASLASLIESGMRAEVVLGLGVEGINSVNNRQLFRGQVKPADPEFEQVIRTLTNAQASGHISFRITPSASDKTPSTLYMTILDEDVSPTLAEELAEMRRILRLDPARREFKVVHGLRPQANDEIAIRTRSISRLINHLSINVEVPSAHLATGLAPDQGDFVDPNPPITIRSGPQSPEDCFAAVCYKGCWFWIDSNDTNSKRTMIYLKRLQALADTGPKSPPPVLTIRAN